MRGELITISLQGDFGKPRPAVIMQANAFSTLSSVTLIPFTSEIDKAPLFRLIIEPSKENGLLKKSALMIDKIHTISREKISKPFGKISKTELIEVERLASLFLGLAE